MKKRIISAAVMIALVILCTGFSDIVRTLFFMAVGVLCAVDMHKALKHKDIKTVPVINGLFIWAMGCISYFSLDKVFLDISFIAAVIAAFVCGIVCEKIDAKGALATCAVCIYPLYPLYMIICIGNEGYWLMLLLTGALATVACDSFALFGGMLLGKHKIAPRVSPNKTVEGCISGLIFSAVAGVVLYFIFQGYGIPVWIFIVISMICSTAGQVGDLAASLIKRWVGVKDYSNLIPGHGGVMDRVDSMLFSIPTAYICFKLFYEINMI